MTSTKPILKSQKSGSAISSNPNVTGGSNGSSSGNNLGGNGGGSQGPPSPWLMPEVPNPHPSASFVEYLRWMREVNREPDNRTGKDPTDPATKVQILQLAQEKANYTERLKVLTKRTKLIAGEGNWFKVTCPWRIRVGGIRGVESMLIPAFDALGMPYIPSSTLRGVARNAAIREFMQEEGLDWKAAEKMIAPYFGSIDTKNPKDSMGKVIFLDAYPMPSKDGGLSVDIANNIWKWDGDSIGKYSPNPNPFLSLKESEFVIGLRVSSTGNQQVLDRVRKWLVKGLQSGVGSQVNSGYGGLTCAEGQIEQPFFRVGFAVRGQLIHGRQKFTQWNYKRNRWDMRGQAEAEVRPIAFKSMLRYWFRAFALGVLPTAQVKLWEATLFGAIEPQKRGYFNIRINDGVLVQEEARASRDNHGEQEGTLLFQYSSEIPDQNKQSTTQLIQNLTWLMFHLGGIGQGARRPLYSRRNRECAPWWRGCNLVVLLDDESSEFDEEFWNLPDSTQAFSTLFQQRLNAFYLALGDLIKRDIKSDELLTVVNPTRTLWSNAVDSNSRIMVCDGDQNFNKPYTLSILHSDELKINQDYDPDLCGNVRGNDVKPSPVWISYPDQKYQVVTVFGATQEPRKKFVQKLRDQGAIQIFPMT